MIFVVLSPFLCIPGLIYLLVMKARKKTVKEDTKYSILAYAMIGGVAGALMIVGAIYRATEPESDNTHKGAVYSDDWRDPGDEWEPDAFGRWGED